MDDKIHGDARRSIEELKGAGTPNATIAAHQVAQMASLEYEITAVRKSIDHASMQSTRLALWAIGVSLLALVVAIWALIAVLNAT